MEERVLLLKKRESQHPPKRTPISTLKKERKRSAGRACFARSAGSVSGKEVW